MTHTRKRRGSKRKRHNYKRMCKVDIASVRQMYDWYKESGEPIQTFSYFNEKKDSMEIVEVDMSDDRYANFFEHGMVCVKCGIRGEYFWLETMGYGKNNKYAKPHFNVYGVKNDGKEMQMTKDHVIPKSKGGLDVLQNYQPMCKQCNANKGDNIEEEFLI